MKDRPCNEKCPLIDDCEDKEAMQKKQALAKATKKKVVKGE